MKYSFSLHRIIWQFLAFPLSYSWRKKVHSLLQRDVEIIRKNDELWFFGFLWVILQALLKHTITKMTIRMLIQKNLSLQTTCPWWRKNGKWVIFDFLFQMQICGKTNENKKKCLERKKTHGTPPLLQHKAWQKTSGAVIHLYTFVTRSVHAIVVLGFGRWAFKKFESQPGHRMVPGEVMPGRAMPRWWQGEGSATSC